MKQHNFFLIQKNKIGISNVRKPKPVRFHEALRTIIITGQFLSLFPLSGICNKNVSELKFKWLSWKCLGLLLSLIGQVFMTTMCIYNSMYSKTSLDIATPVIFYGTTCIMMLTFFRIATLWPKLVRDITEIEESDPNYDKVLKNKCNITCIIVLNLSLLEHILSLLSAFTKTTELCDEGSWHDTFMKYLYPWVLRYLPYSPLLGAALQFIHFQAVFVWNYSDLFIICTSYYLTSRLQHINSKVLFARQKYLPETFWRTTRQNYRTAVELVRKVDDVISGIIFMSFANNLFFVCLQLLHTLERSSALGDYNTETYFILSLIFLISRSIAVILIASQVNTTSMAPAPILYDVPSQIYCVEIQRFLDQVNGRKVALTGLQFFYITRGLLLTVAGTIVTYELVMIQLDSSPSSIII